MFKFVSLAFPNPILSHSPGCNKTDNLASIYQNNTTEVNSSTNDLFDKTSLS